MSPVFSQEFAPDTQSQPSILLPLAGDTETSETGKRVRASFTALGLALSLGATGSLVSSAEAADSMQLAALPSIAGDAGTLPSVGSSRPLGAGASYHTVTDGETIWDIARQHGLTVNDIKAANGIGEGQVIQAGQVLKVPTVAVNAAPLMEVELETAPEAAPVNKAEAVQETAEVTVAALPESGLPIQSQQKLAIEDLALDVPQAAPASEAPVLAIAPEEVTEPNFDAADELAAPQAEATSQTESAPATLPVSKADPFSNKTPLATLPESAPQAESVQRFAEQLSTVDESAEPRQSISVQSEEAAPQLSVTAAGTHRVNSGETIWSIARRYSLDPDALQQANRIENPRLIVPGDELTIPANAPSRATRVSEVEGVSYLQLAGERQMAAIAPVIEATPASETNAKSSVSEVEAADPFVEDMLSEVASATTRSQVGETATVAAQPAAELPESFGSESEELDVTAVGGNSDAAAVAVNPQFADDAESGLTSLEVDSRSEELLAAAPLGSEVYAPVVENPTGRVVTPEMPVLPGQDAYLPEAPNRFDGYMWPAQGVLTSGFGWRWGRMHRGVDIAGPVGTPIYAAAPGVVVSSGWNSGGYGNLVDIRHPDGSMTRYAHNSRLMVSAGQQVRQGQQIAEMGSTGYSTGPHLHFEVHIPNQGTVNPIAMLPGR